MKKLMPAMLFAAFLAAPIQAGFTPSINGNGVRWESAASETWSGSSQTRSDGVVLQLAGAFDSSVDTTNGAGVTGYLGLLDPILTTTGCVIAMIAADFNLDGVNGVDARDLLILYTVIKSGEGIEIDFDCSGVTDIGDLIQFSQFWKAAVK